MKLLDIVKSTNKEQIASVVHSLVPKICSFYSDVPLNNDSKIEQACEKILIALLHVSKPTEFLLLLCEQLDATTDDAKRFGAFIETDWQLYTSIEVQGTLIGVDPRISGCVHRALAATH